MPKKLNEQQLHELKDWLQSHEIVYKNLHRDFSDCLPVANLLKKFYSKLVELHNYPPRNNTQLKVNNWETLNLKVLSKIGLQQNKQMLEKFAKAIPGAIESLLYDIMIIDREQQQQKAGDHQINEQEKIWTENDEIMTVTVNKRIGDGLIQVPQKMILYSLYEEAIKQCQAKDNYITAAQQKITHLENVIQLKAERIDELCAQLAKVSVRNLLSHVNRLEHSHSGPVLNDNVSIGSNFKENGSEENITI
ncbi:sperm flagellar protein 1 [Musca domestica]|uniref:Sperm flagellar protein 1 isoform X1 n=1 Tax=Musca domestica TaxID=7370 RepID=A0A1I8N236_MUSDO|nr:sperm flagellar protein 1 [Musca domestica]